MQLSTYRGIVSRYGDFYSEIAEVPGTHWREMEDDRGPLLLREGKRYGGERGIRAMGGQRGWAGWLKGVRKGKRVREEGRGRETERSVGNSTIRFIRMIRHRRVTQFLSKTRDFYTALTSITYHICLIITLLILRERKSKINDIRNIFELFHKFHSLRHQNILVISRMDLNVPRFHRDCRDCL